MRRVDRFKTDPAGTQARLLRRLLKRAASTEWGRRYGFDRIASHRDVVTAYRDAVPIHGYEDYRQDVGRARRAEKDIFWPGSFLHFAVSSGTVSDGRIIPLSAKMLRLDRRFSLTAASNYVRTSRAFEVLRGRLLTVPGRIEPDPQQPGAVIGEVSGLLALFSPRIVRAFYEAVPHDVLNMDNWDAKLDTIVDLTMSKDVRAIAMVPSWAVVLFKKLIARYSVQHGRPVDCVRDVWPNLRVFFSGGVALSSYRQLLLKQVGPPAIDFIESYGASEGFVSFQDRPDRDDMLVDLDNGMFLEFVPMEDASETPRRYSIGEVESGVRYRLYVSSCSGLWSYGIGDVVEFTSTRPHRIRVSGRTSEVIDAYGEAVYGDEARRALERACVLTAASVRDYHVAPIPLSESRMPGHQWLVEFETPPGDLDRLADEIDRELQVINRHYVIRREAEAFSAPEVIALSGGTFYDWLKRTRKTVSAQTKVPRMSDDSRIADELLSISRNNT